MGNRWLAPASLAATVVLGTGVLVNPVSGERCAGQDPAGGACGGPRIPGWRRGGVYG
jgi:hypothetical protein